jgi:hypothetical protein
MCKRQGIRSRCASRGPDSFGVVRAVESSKQASKALTRTAWFGVGCANYPIDPDRVVSGHSPDPINGA